MSSREVMMGNHAIARGLVEAGLELAAAYPGTPSSEILPGIIAFNKREGLTIHAEWSVNERCAMEAAFGAALAGKRAACMMKQVGLNVAFPALLHGRDRGIRGGLVIVSCDDPGPQSSQTEQDSRLLATLFGIPVFDPSSPREAADTAYHAMNYSFEQKTPVIVRSTHRVSHAREAVSLCAPRSREVILEEGVQAGGEGRIGVVASGMSYAVVRDVIDELGLGDVLALYKVLRVHPLDGTLRDFVRGLERVLVVEETDQVLEAMLAFDGKICGRRNNYVPAAGELGYDVVREAVQRVVREAGIPHRAFAADPGIDDSLEGLAIKPRPPELCAGCPHRASFYAMARAYPRAIFPGDIGCYTLGISIGAVDTCLDMGAGVTLASGFYDAFAQDGEVVPIIASVGDSTFFHACLSPLRDALAKGRRFILVVMDNGTTAMTGMQPTPQTGVTAEGTQSRSLSIEHVVSGLGASYLKVLDPYDVPLMLRTVEEAQRYLEDGGRGPAVIIARRACVLAVKAGPETSFDPSVLLEACTGCRRCVTKFGCPGLVFDEEKKRISFDERICTGCGICLYACPQTPQGKLLTPARYDAIP